MTLSTTVYSQVGIYNISPNTTLNDNAAINLKNKNINTFKWK
jgi:hypothetical protein